MTSEISSPVTLARSRAALMATSPSLWAGKVAKAPLKDPTGVRAADTMTTSSMGNLFLGRLALMDKQLWRGAQNAANAGIGKPWRNRLGNTETYRIFKRSSGVCGC